ncbi:hypothetical protein K8T06_05670 [bacterium]|nr:hypothetical protein [bacterium]
MMSEWIDFHTLEVSITSVKIMEIPKKDLDEFKAIYKKDYGEELSDEKAQVIAGRVVTLMGIVCQPFPKSREKPKSM